MVVRWASLPFTCQGKAVHRWFFPVVITLLAVSVVGQEELPSIDDLDPPDEVIDELYGGAGIDDGQPRDVLQEEKAMGIKNRKMIAELEEKRMPTTPLPGLPGYNSYTNDWGATVPITPDVTVNDNGEQIPQNLDPYGYGGAMLATQQQMSQVSPKGGQASMLATQQSLSQANIPDPDIPGHNNAAMLQQGVAPVKGNTPEAIGNIMNYELQEPTPPPPPLGGVYCRGGACQYRVPPPLPLGIIVKPFPQIIFPNNRREFCHGLSCIPKLGWPPKYDAGFADLCQRLFEYHGGGYFNTLADKNGIKNLDDLKQAVIHWCKLRTPGDEHANCPAYGDVFVAANVHLIDKPTISGSRQVCNNLHFFLGQMKGAEANLKLRKELLPEGFSLVQKEPTGLNRFGGGGVGPNSIHGREWRKTLMKRGYKFPDGSIPDVATVDTKEPLPGAPQISLIKVESETEDSLACRTRQAAEFLQVTGYGPQHGAPVPALKSKPARAPAGAAAKNIKSFADLQKVSFAQGVAQAPAPADDKGSSNNDSSEPVSFPPGPLPSGWPIPPKAPPQMVRKPPVEALAEVSAGIADFEDIADADKSDSMLPYIMNAPKPQDPDEGEVLSDQPPADYGVIKPFGVHTFQSRPQTLQSFGSNNAQQPGPPPPPPMALEQNTPGVTVPAQQPPMGPPLMALEQNAPGAPVPAQQPPMVQQQDTQGSQASDDKSEMEAEDLFPSAGDDGNPEGPTFLQKNDAVSKRSLLSKTTGEKLGPDFTSYAPWDPLYRSGARPKYDKHFPCRLGVNKPPQSKVMYQLLPPVPWPIGLPPVEISGDMLQFCSAEFSEIMAGFPQTADTIVDQVGSWCGWQSSMSSWVGRQQELGHPDWNFRTCAGMQYFVALFLRDELGTPDARPPGFFCSKFFLGMPALYRVEALIKDAWSGPSGRSLDPSRMVTGGGGGGGDPELLRAMQEYAEALFAKLRGQRDAFLDMNGAKMDEGAFKQPPTGAPPPMERPSLPNSADLPILLQSRVNHSIGAWHAPSPEESPPAAPPKTRSSFLGSIFNIGEAWLSS